MCILFDTTLARLINFRALDSLTTIDYEFIGLTLKVIVVPIITSAKTERLLDPKTPSIATDEHSCTL